MKHLTDQRIYHGRRTRIASSTGGNKLHAAAVFPNAVAENNGYAGATGCEAHSDFAQVSGHGFFVPVNHFFLSLETCSRAV